MFNESPHRQPCGNPEPFDPFVVCVVVMLFFLIAGFAWGESPVKVIRSPSGNGYGQCSVVLVGGGYGLTAEHCGINPRSTVQLSPATAARSSVVYDPPKNGIDEAVLILVADPSDRRTIRIGPAPSVGDPVTAEGYPSGSYQLYSGRVISFTSKQNMIVCDFPLESGASGGGLFNAAGELIGIASATDGLSSYWIHTDSLQQAMRHAKNSDVEQPPQPYQRTGSDRRVVALTVVGCRPCELLKRDVASGKYPGFAFEFATYNHELQQWDKPELYEAFVSECNPGKGLAAPTIWVPGSGQYKAGYAEPKGLIGWIDGIVKSILGIPPPTLPNLANPGSNLGSPATPGTGPGLSQEGPQLLSEVAELRGNLDSLKENLEQLKSGTIAEKLAAIESLRTDVSSLKSNVSETRTAISNVREDPLGWLIALITGALTATAQGYFEGRRKGLGVT